MTTVEDVGMNTRKNGTTNVMMIGKTNVMIVVITAAALVLASGVGWWLVNARSGALIPGDVALGQVRGLGDYIPADIADLSRAVRRSIRRTGSQQSLLRSFFKHAKLKL